MVGVIAGVAGAKVDNLPIRWPNLIGSPLLVHLEQLAPLNDELRMIPTELSHVLLIGVCCLESLESLPILADLAAGDHPGGGRGQWR